MRSLIRRLRYKLHQWIIEEGNEPLIFVGVGGTMIIFAAALILVGLLAGVGVPEQIVNPVINAALFVPLILTLATLFSVWLRTRALLLMTMARELRAAARKAASKRTITDDVVREMADKYPSAFHLIRGTKGINLFFLLFATKNKTFNALKYLANNTQVKYRYRAQSTFFRSLGDVPDEWNQEVSELFQRKDVSTLSILMAVKKFPAVTDFNSDKVETLPERSYSAPLQERHDKLNERLLHLEDMHVPLSSKPFSALVSALQEIEDIKNDPFRLGDFAQALDKAERNMQSLEDSHRAKQKKALNAKRGQPLDYFYSRDTERMPF